VTVWVVVVSRPATVTLNVVLLCFSIMMGMAFALCRGGAFRETALSAKVWWFFGLVSANPEIHRHTEDNHQRAA
jgi:hypothetical protein